MKWKIYYFLLNGYKVKQILESSPAINETLNVLQREPGKWVKILKLFSSLTNYGGQVYKMCPKCFPSLSICWGVGHNIKERRNRRSCHAYQLRGENLNILSLRIFQECHHLDPFQSHHCTGELHNKYIHVYTYLCQCTRDNVHSTTEYGQISVKRSSKGGKVSTMVVVSRFYNFLMLVCTFRRNASTKANPTAKIQANEQCYAFD